MKEGKNIPLVVMLFAGSMVSIACIVYKFSLTQTLIFVLATLVVFYLICLIIKKIILKINHDAEQRAVLLAREEEAAKRKELAEREVIEDDFQ